MSIETLFNYGVKSINDTHACPPQNTVVVIGVARGGTSMTAGVLYHLGVQMHKAKEPVYEEVHIAAAFEEQSDDDLKQIIDNCNRFDQWAFKRPAAIDYLERTQQHLRNPRYIFVFRDIFAIANRSEISVNGDALPLMSNALEQYSKAVSFLQSTSSPCLICSSEKMTRYPRQTIETIARFCGLTPDAETLNAAIESIDPESTSYLKISRHNRTHGQIGLVTKDTLRGWAAWWSSDEPVEVEIYLDDELYQVVCANESRPHLAKKQRTRNGFCGFSVALPENRMNDGTVLRARIKTDVADLEYSPWQYQSTD